MMEPDSISVEVPNAILFVRDPSFWDFPEPEREGAVWANSRGISVGCRPDCDGPTDITIGAASAVGRTDHLQYDGELETPTRQVPVAIVPGDTILEQNVPNTKTRVRVWTDGRPDAVTVTIGLEG
jgi:hypothetical protein